jgi:NUMOD3 motif-containing protein
MRPLKTDYYNQKSNARARGIAFELTFEQWLIVWLQSGKLAQRGCRRHQYVMARYRDRGPYAVGNVKIITMSENMIEGQTGRKHSDATKRLMSLAKLGNQNARQYD